MALSLSRKNTLTELAERYAANLDETAHIFLSGRGLSNETIEEHRLGVVGTDAPSEHLPYRGLLSIPYRTKTGVCAFKFRQLDNQRQPKYLIPTGQKTRMFNVLATFTDLPFMCVCEGEIDALVASQAGLPAVGVPGVRAWKPQHPRLLDGFEHVIVLADNDEKEDGSNPGHELARAIMEDLPQAQVAWLPRGMDVNALYLVGGSESIVSLLPKPLRGMLKNG